jgi:hypothetical protein
LRQTNKARLVNTTDCLAPAEYFFDQCVFLQAHFVAMVRRRAAIDGAVFLLRRRPVDRAAEFFNSLLKEFL